MPVNILFIQYYFYPDISSVSQLLEEFLCELVNKKNINVTVLCARTKKEKYSTEINTRKKSSVEKTNKIHIKRLFVLKTVKSNNVIRLFDFFLFSLQAWLFLLFYSRRWLYVVSMSSPPLIGIFSALGLITNSGTKHIHYVQDLYPDILYNLRYIKSWFLYRVLRKCNSLVYKKAYAIIVIGIKMKERLISEYLVQDKKIVVIENWDNKVKNRRLVNEGRFRIMYSGNSGVAHDFSKLKSFIKTVKEVPQVEYCFYGGGSRYSIVKEIFSKESENRVEFHNYVKKDRVSDNLARANILVIAQKKETVGCILPSKYYSYLRAGRPILYFGPRDSEIGIDILKNDIGRVIENNGKDVEKAAQYIRRLIKHYNLNEKIGERANRLYEHTMGLNKALEKFTNLIHC